MKKVFQEVSLFLFLTPIFFVFHGYFENFGFLDPWDTFLLMLTYSGAAAGLYFIFLFFYRNHFKAALLASYLLGFFLFFGALHDFFKEKNIPLHRYSIILPLFFASVLFLLIYFKRTKKLFIRTSLFLNLLFSIYIIVDLGGTLWKFIHPVGDRLSVYSFAKTNVYPNCKECPKPDIYFLLFDEYASTVSLRNTFGYDNSDLDSFLLKEGFNIQAHSRSNYNFTPFSMGAILNMAYLNGIPNPNSVSVDDDSYAIRLVRDNQAIKLLSAQGYDIINYSIFDLAGNPSRVDQNFLPLKTKLITNTTLFAYLQRDIGWRLYTGSIKIKWLMENSLFRHLYNNEKFISLVERESSLRSDHPRFVYAHLSMPHVPFFYDKNGNRKDAETVHRELSEVTVQGYLDYLPYVNSKAKELITTIKQNTNGNAVIIFMGDHGFRYHEKPNYPVYFFQNQNAAYFPDKDYHLFYDSISGVNQFRVIFNKLFKENIPLLKDSSVFLQDKK